jgi:hypothetical protein
MAVAIVNAFEVMETDEGQREHSAVCMRNECVIDEFAHQYQCGLHRFPHCRRVEQRHQEYSFGNRVSRYKKLIRWNFPTRKILGIQRANPRRLQVTNGNVAMANR